MKYVFVCDHFIYFSILTPYIEVCIVPYTGVAESVIYCLFCFVIRKMLDQM